MPHISLKMLKGRTEEQKMKATKMLAEALCNAIGCSSEHVSVSVDDYTPEEWQDVYAKEVANNKSITKVPNYNPKDLLKK